MTNENETSQTRKPSSDLEQLGQRLDELKAKHKEPETNAGDGSVLGMAWRLSTELVVSVLVGTGLGHLLDKFFGTGPWILLVGLGFGFAAGIMTTLRTADRMDAVSANIPIGDDITDEDEEDF